MLPSRDSSPLEPGKGGSDKPWDYEGRVIEAMARLERERDETRSELDTLRGAADALILGRKGWERWGEGGYLYDHLAGFGEGTVYDLPSALRKLAGR